MVKQQSLGQLRIEMLADPILKFGRTNRIKSGLHQHSIGSDRCADHLGGDFGQFFEQGITRPSALGLSQLAVRLRSLWSIPCGRPGF